MGNTKNTDDFTGFRVTDSSESLTHLKQRRQELADRRARSQRQYSTLLGVGLLMALMSPWFRWRYRTSELFSKVGGVLLVYVLTPLAMAPTFRMRLRDAETDLQDIDFQIDLRQFEVGKEESRAEKILRMNEVQLRRYYDMNLHQNSWVFSLGVVCILLGVSIIGLSLYLVLDVAPTREGKVIVASLGAVGSILTNLVAAIYLRMNASASQNLTAFHSRLVDTHQLLLANLLASRIEDNEQRWRTLALLATGLTAIRHGAPADVVEQTTPPNAEHHARNLKSHSLLLVPPLGFGGSFNAGGE